MAAHVGMDTGVDTMGVEERAEAAMVVARVAGETAEEATVGAAMVEGAATEMTAVEVRTAVAMAMEARAAKRAVEERVLGMEEAATVVVGKVEAARAVVTEGVAKGGGEWAVIQ